MVVWLDSTLCRTEPVVTSRYEEYWVNTMGAAAYLGKGFLAAVRMPQV